MRVSSWTKRLAWGSPSGWRTPKSWSQTQLWTQTRSRSMAPVSALTPCRRCLFLVPHCLDVRVHICESEGGQVSNFCPKQARATTYDACQGASRS